MDIQKSCGIIDIRYSVMDINKLGLNSKTATHIIMPTSHSLHTDCLFTIWLKYCKKARFNEAIRKPYEQFSDCLCIDPQ